MEKILKSSTKRILRINSQAFSEICQRQNLKLERKRNFSIFIPRVLELLRNTLVSKFNDSVKDKNNSTSV